ncbi:MAG: MFS transporter [Candidatus Puniceispirillaceae bacterium]
MTDTVMPRFLMPTLLMIVFVNFVGVGALIPILPYTVIDELGYSETVMTSLLASFSLAMFIGNPLLGRLSDLIGRKTVLLSSLAIGAASHLVFAFSNDIIVLFAARIVAGFAFGNIGVIQAIIADQSAPQDRAKYMGFMGAFIGAGFVFGPAIGGLLSGIGSGPLHQAPFLLAGIFTILSALLCLRLPSMPASSTSHASSEDKTKKTGSFQSLLVMLRGPLGLFALAFFLLNLSFSQVEASFVLLLKDLLDFGATDTGWLFTYVGVCIIIVQGGLISPVVKRFGEMPTIIGGASCLTAGQVMTALLGFGLLANLNATFAIVMICTTIVCVGFAFTNPTLSSSASKAARSDEMGGSLGLVQGFGSLGQVIGLTAAGPLYATGGGGLSFGVGGVISLILVVIVIGISWRSSQPATP